MATYTVKPGDDLSKIALAVYGDGCDANGRKIFEANRAVIENDPNALRPGQVLTIP
jgi:nucleoid-associated protein YgaU